VGELRERVLDSGLDVCVVLNEERIVLGALRGDALAKEPDAAAGEVMDRARRPSVPTCRSRSSSPLSASYGIKSWIVTTPHGVYLGLLTRDDAERALADVTSRAR
jgi:hypothetical protein